MNPVYWYNSEVFVDITCQACAVWRLWLVGICNVYSYGIKTLNDGLLDLISLSVALDDVYDKGHYLFYSLLFKINSLNTISFEM